MRTETKLYYALENLTLWAEVVMRERRKQFEESCRERRYLKEKHWQPGVRGDMQIYGNLESQIASEEAAMKDFERPISESNVLLDEIISAGIVRQRINESEPV